MAGTVPELIALLELEALDTDLFRGCQPDTQRKRVFGGQVAAQALVAASRTIDPAYVAHSLHSYFLLPGDTAIPILYDVQRLRDGRSFATRRVVARQHGRPIYYQTVNFQKAEAGFEHQDTMPEVIEPDRGLDLAELSLQRRALDLADGRDEMGEWAREWAALDIRSIGTSADGLASDPDHPARARLWFRVAQQLTDDPLQHLGAFTYASDMTLLGATLVPHGVDFYTPGVQVASLDHAVWFHRPFRADQWWLYDQVSPTASGGRGLVIGRVFTPAGVLVASVAQEGLIRQRRG
ncbi:MAG: acyl-CoA thioesterase [Nocardioides sp.]